MESSIVSPGSKFTVSSNYSKISDFDATSTLSLSERDSFSNFRPLYPASPLKGDYVTGHSHPAVTAPVVVHKPHNVTKQWSKTSQFKKNVRLGIGGRRPWPKFDLDKKSLNQR